MQTEQTSSDSTMRSRIVLVIFAAAILELCLGTFYAWSVFKKPLMQLHHWTDFQVTVPFSLNAFFTGLATLFIGARADRSPKWVALAGGILFGIGLMVAGWAAQTGQLFLLNLSFGVAAGVGIGLGYIAGIAVPIKWASQRRGLVGGIIIMCFGAGAMGISFAAPHLFKHFSPGAVLAGMGLIGLILCIPTALLMNNPPAFKPQARPAGLANLLPKDVLSQWGFWAIWLMVFLNVYAGFAILAHGVPMFEKIFSVTKEKAGYLMGIVLICNGLGRIFWSTLSDKLGRRKVLVTIFASLIAVFAVLIHLSNVYLFAAACCYIVLCYGGVFGTMPAFTADSFGVGQMGRVYGPVLTAISAGGLTGPLVYSFLMDKTGGYQFPLMVIAGLMVLAMFLPFTVGRKSAESESAPKPKLENAR